MNRGAVNRAWFTDDHEIFRSSVRTFVEREILPHVDKWEEEEDFPLELFEKAGEAGFLGIGHPEEYGGTECDIFYEVVYVEEIIRCGSVGLASTLGASGIAVPPILALGTHEQKKKFCEPALLGKKRGVLGVTEPCCGSDVASIQTRAVRKDDHYIVNGTKTFITGGTRADFVTAAVRTGGTGAKGISLLIIEKGTPGFTASRKIPKMGWHASDTAELSFMDCRVPLGNLVGEENQGFRGIMQNFQKERLYLALEAQTVAQMALEEALEYVQERTAFGQTIGSFQVNRHKLAEMATEVEAARQFNYSVADRIGKGESLMKEVCMAKNFSTRVCDRVVYDALQLHGGYGYTREYPVERMYRDSRLFSIGGGTYEIMNDIIGRELLA